ncbi:peptidyl-prolyl cis-trans isomerase SlyD FKBP-type [Prevotella sp. CAG:5226]|uniref:FKBP-type peptidyl-prolyl cis-trans isomerase n=1 Tax=Prevotellamassilia timonensis TaxID=1852370 RepID=UPI00033F911F|nr:peptidyl-prolyl cis-trans isomerase SlyD FKBP-type [Prevotella sp. CAG:5226]
MEQQTPNKYVTVAYELYTDNDKGIHELVEKAPIEHPFQFISGLGIALDSFENKILALTEGEAFDFVLKVDEAYGPYEQDHVIELPKETFAINGRFDKDMVYPGAVLPLVNADGMRFQGLVLELKDNTVIIDLNHPLAGKDLHFKGQVVTMRDATNEEIQALINHEGCNCGGDCEGGCEGGCGGHHHEHGEGECCGKHEHGKGECCGKHEHGEGCGCHK